MSDLTLRDRLALGAMQGWVTAGAFNQQAENMMKKAGIGPGRPVEIFIARLAYSMADAMIEVRAEGGDDRMAEVLALLEPGEYGVLQLACELGYKVVPFRQQTRCEVGRRLQHADGMVSAGKVFRVQGHGRERRYVVVTQEGGTH